MPRMGIDLALCAISPNPLKGWFSPTLLVVLGEPLTS
jgi:hypothetical protein